MAYVSFSLLHMVAGHCMKNEHQVKNYNKTIAIKINCFLYKYKIVLSNMILL